MIPIKPAAPREMRHDKHWRRKRTIICSCCTLFAYILFVFFHCITPPLTRRRRWRWAQHHVDDAVSMSFHRVRGKTEPLLAISTCYLAASQFHCSHHKEVIFVYSRLFYFMVTNQSRHGISISCSVKLASMCSSIQWVTKWLTWCNFCSIGLVGRWIRALTKKIMMVIVVSIIEMECSKLKNYNFTKMK